MDARGAVMSPDETSAITFHIVNTLSHSSHDGGQMEQSGTNRTPLNAAFVILLYCECVCVCVLYTDGVSGHRH